ncbi:hypothetical protein K474DRAFT_1678647 [Panus rudis PR-1116 ss-1]|nr:hypothetical protein K474DRAFT_1678647 [Panus rudis PR-1116 ss-1]
MAATDSDNTDPSVAARRIQGCQCSSRQTKAKASQSKATMQGSSGSKSEPVREDDGTGFGIAQFGLGGSATANAQATSSSASSRVGAVLHKLSAGTEALRSLRSTGLDVSKSTISHEEAAAEAELGRSRMALLTKSKAAGSKTVGRRVASEPAVKPSTKRKTHAATDKELKVTGGVVLRPCGVGYDKSIIDGSAGGWYLYESLLPAHARDFEFSRHWNMYELEGALRERLPHVFAYFDCLPARADGELHWVLCGKDRANSYVAAHNPTVVKTGGSWKEKIVYIASREEVPIETLREWRNLSRANAPVSSDSNNAATGSGSSRAKNDGGPAAVTPQSSALATTLFGSDDDLDLPHPSTLLSDLRTLKSVKGKEPLKPAPPLSRSHSPSDIDSEAHSDPSKSDDDISDSMKSPPRKIQKNRNKQRFQARSYAGGDTDAAESQSGSDPGAEDSNSDSRMTNLLKTVEYVRRSIEDAKARAQSGAASIPDRDSPGPSNARADSGSGQGDHVYRWSSKSRRRVTPQPHPMTVGPVNRGFVDLTIDDPLDRDGDTVIDESTRPSPVPSAPSSPPDLDPPLDNPPRRNCRAAARDRYNFDF